MKLLKKICLYIFVFVITFALFKMFGLLLTVTQSIIGWLYLVPLAILAIDIIILLPLCIFVKTRPYVVIGYYISCLIFVMTFLAYSLWWVIIPSILFITLHHFTPMAEVATYFANTNFLYIKTLVILTCLAVIYQMYSDKNGIDSFLKEAITWFRNIAKQWYITTQYHLGLMNYRCPIINNSTEAAKWYRKAAEQGHAEAQYNLGLIYFRGNGIKENLTEAAHWFRKAATQQLTAAEYALAVAYESGLGVETNFEEAAKWYHRAARPGIYHPDAVYRLWQMYRDGRGVTRDFEKAKRCLYGAATTGHTEAQCVLGEMYYSGEGFEKDLKKAAIWFHKAAKRGNPDAAFMLGEMYYSGEGFEKDYQEAYKWLSLAGMLGIKNPPTELDDLKSKLTTNQITKADKFIKNFWNNTIEKT